MCASVRSQWLLSLVTLFLPRLFVKMPSQMLRGTSQSALTFAAPVSSNRRPVRVLVPIARGSEELETACTTDVLARAGAEVTLASAEPSLEVQMEHGLRLLADIFLFECISSNWDAIVCPGGEEGAERLSDCTEFTDLLRRQRLRGGILAASGASPAALLAEHRLLEYDEKATCYPKGRFKKTLSAACAGWWDAPVVRDRRVITAQGPGTALQLSLKVVEVLFGASCARELAGQLLTQAPP